MSLTLAEMLAKGSVNNEQVLREIQGGDRVSLPTVAKELPGKGSAPHCAPRTLVEWGTIGCRTMHGRVKLEIALVGCRWFTSRAALARFFEAITRLEVSCGA